MKTQLSLITSTIGQPPRLCKHVTRGTDGTITATATARLIEGKVERVEVSSLQELAELQDTMTIAQAMAYGVTKPATARIMSRVRREAQADPTEILTRTRDCFAWSDGPGICFLDFDPPTGAAALTPGALVNTLRAAVPELQCVSLLVRPSSGSCIYDANTGEQLRGVAGMHVYFFVSHAANIPDIGNAIEAALWLHGHGRIDIGKAGNLLYRTLIDTAVFQPERLDFSRADCGTGLEQRMAQWQIFSPTREDLFADAAGCAMPTPSREEHARVLSLKAAKGNDPDIVRQARDAKTAHARMEAHRQLGEGASHDAVSERALLIANGLDKGVLTDDHKVRMSNGLVVTVREIRESSADYDGQRCADPIEWDYGDGCTVGIVKDHPLRIDSFAHGGCTYWLFDWMSDALADFEVLPSPCQESLSTLRQKSRDEVLTSWVAMALPLSEFERGTMVDEVARLTGEKLRRLNAALKEAQEVESDKRNAAAIAQRADGRQIIHHLPEDSMKQAMDVERQIVARSRPDEYSIFANTLSQITCTNLPHSHRIDDPEAPPPPVLQINELNKVEVLGRVESVVVFARSGKSGGSQMIPVPYQIIENLRLKSHHTAPVVTGLVPHPIVLRDGTILACNGLHVPTGLFLSGASIQGARPYTQAESARALGRLHSFVLEGFDFATALDSAVALAGLFTGLQRKLMDSAPGLAVIASVQSSGKTTLARRIHVLLTGRDMPVLTFTSGNEDETRKHILAVLLRNPVMVTFDNIPDGYTFRSGVIASVMTSATFSDRRLGSTAEVEVPTNTLFVITGNNLSLGTDEVSRWMVCRLAPTTAKPEQRVFAKPDVVSHALSIRNEVLRDVIGIVSGYRTFAAQSVPSASRHHQWDCMVRQPLIWAGGIDVAKVFENNHEQSEEDNAFEGLLVCLHSAFATEWFTSREVVAAVQGLLPNDQLLIDIPPRLESCLINLRASDPKKELSVGRVLSAKTGRVGSVGGVEMRLESRNDKRTSSKQYRVC